MITFLHSGLGNRVDGSQKNLIHFSEPELSDAELLAMAQAEIAKRKLAETLAALPAECDIPHRSREPSLHFGSGIDDIPRTKYTPSLS